MLPCSTPASRAKRLERVPSMHTAYPLWPVGEQISDQVHTVSISPEVVRFRNRIAYWGLWDLEF